MSRPTAADASRGFCSSRSSSIGMWQRMRCPSSTSTSGGSCSTQIGPRKRGQRVWKTQPDGGEAALGMSPSSLIRSRPPPSIVGTAERSASVYGWCGPSKTDVGRAELLQPAEVEDGDAVRDVADDAEVVRDEDVRDPLLGLELDEQVEDRRLHGDVERGRRLVADHELGIAGERARDRHALLEAAGELHGLLRERALGQADARRRGRSCAPRPHARSRPRASAASAAGSGGRSGGG